MDMNVEPIEIMKEDGSFVMSAKRRRGKEDDKSALGQRLVTFQGVHCLHVASNIALVLGPSSTRSDTFERLGLCVVHSTRNRI